MKKIFTLTAICALLFSASVTAQDFPSDPGTLMVDLELIAADFSSGDTIANPVQSVVVTSSGKAVLAPTHARRALLKQVRDSINAIPFDTTRDDDYWRRAIVNGKWSFFTDPTVKLPGLLKLASEAYKFYTKAFNNYDTAYVVGIDKDWKMMLINNDWFDSYGGLVGKNRELTMYMYFFSRVSLITGFT